MLTETFTNCICLLEYMTSGHRRLVIYKCIISDGDYFEGDKIDIHE